MITPTGLTLDLYHLDSAYVSWRSDHNEDATFDLYSRSHAFGGSYLLVAGLELALAFVRDYRFDDEDLAYVREIRDYDAGFLDELARLRFSGEITAMPEGTIAFADEPLVRVTAPFREALLLESGLLHLISASTVLATKAARMVDAADGRAVAEFGLRRAQAPDLAVRASWIGGCASTSYVDAARRYGLPSSGTVPHAVIQSYPSEEEAFRAIAEALPRYTLLLDTYDVARAIETGVRVARDTRASHGHEMAAVRLDSGDLVADARHVRKVLDDAGLGDVKILVSGDLDEFKIAEMLARGTPIDAFGVGTRIATAAGSVERGVEGGSISTAYKLVAFGGEPVVKAAEGKETTPGRKQVTRVGTFDHDVIALEDEQIEGEPLLDVVLRGTDPAGAAPSLDDARERARAQLSALPERHRRLDAPEPYEVRRTERLERLREEALRKQGVR